jgi:hypothetical protein
MSWFRIPRRSSSPQLDAPPLVEHIIIPAGALSSEDPSEIVAAVVSFVVELVDRGGFDRSEVPMEALLCYAVDDYLGRVSNGGHGKYASDRGEDEDLLWATQQGLAAIGAVQTAKLFNRFLRFRRWLPSRFARAAQGGGFGKGDCYVERLDRKFFALPSDMLVKLNGNWLRTLPILKPVQDDEIETVLRSLIADNPNSSARLVEREESRERLIAEAKANDPLFQGLKFVTEKAAPEVEFVARVFGIVHRTEGGRTGGHWGVMTSEGLASVYLFRHVAIFRFFDETAKPVPVSIAEVEQEVRRRTGQNLPERAFSP